MILSYTLTSLVGKVELPASKSISHRALIIRALCKESFEIVNLSKANDTLILADILEEVKQQRSMIRCDAHDAGTPLRFLASFLSIQEGRRFVLEGTKRLNERPIKHLVDALVSLGASINYLHAEGFPPLSIEGARLKGGRVAVVANISSQFISSLCLIAPMIPSGLLIELRNEIVSNPYIEMTLQIMTYFGIAISKEGNVIAIGHQNYTPKPITIENDWSSACFFYAMCMLADRKEIELHGLWKESTQGDRFIAELASSFGIETRWDEHGITVVGSESQLIVHPECLNLSSYPDLAIPLIVACAVNYPQISFCGIEHLEWKESKRITALQTELQKVGVKLIYEQSILRFDQSAMLPVSHVDFCSHGDHRIVMALSMLALTGWRIQFDETDCVKKSFPGFFDQLKTLGFEFGNDRQHVG